MKAIQKIDAGFYWIRINAGWTIGEIDFDDEGIVVDMIGKKEILRTKDLKGVEIYGPIAPPQIQFTVFEDLEITSFKIELDKKEAVK